MGTWARLAAGAAIIAGSVILAGGLEYVGQLKTRADLRAVADRIEQRIVSQTQVLASLRALLVADNLQYDLAQVRQYLALVSGDGLVSGMQGIGIAVRQESAKTEYALGRLREFYGASQRIWPETDQPERYPIVLLEPPDPRNRAAFGYDMYSEPVRRDAIDRAVRSGKSAATAPVKLMQEITPDKQVGFLIYTPVRLGGGGKAYGVVYAPYRVGDFMREVLSKPTDLGVAVRVTDKATGTLMLDADPHFRAALESFPIHVADREWEVGLAFRERPSPWRGSLAVIAAGLLVAYLTHRLLLQKERRMEAERSALHEREKAAELRALLLDESRHRLKNVIARVSAIARMSARQTGSKEEFEAALQRQLIALAAAQSVLDTGKTNGASLRDLILAELSSIGGRQDHVTLEGPHARLTENEAQAVGLVIHELLTNALKYGALSLNPSGSLHIRWTCADRLTVEWLEEGVFTFNEEAAGFGTKLLDTVIVRQLRGEYRREVGSGLFRQTIAWKPASPQASG